MPINHWDEAAIKKYVFSVLADTAPLVANFVEDDARKRLLAIKDPDTNRDKNYRNYLANYVLTSDFEMMEDGVEIVIGMKVKPGSGGNHHGYYIEKGSKTAGAHPFLLPALMENQKKIFSILVG